MVIGSRDHAQHTIPEATRPTVIVAEASHVAHPIQDDSGAIPVSPKLVTAEVVPCAESSTVQRSTDSNDEDAESGNAPRIAEATPVDANTAVEVDTNATTVEVYAPPTSSKTGSDSSTTEVDKSDRPGDTNASPKRVEQDGQSKIHEDDDVVDDGGFPSAAEKEPVPMDDANSNSSSSDNVDDDPPLATQASPSRDKEDTNVEDDDHDDDASARSADDRSLAGDAYVAGSHAPSDDEEDAGSPLATQASPSRDKEDTNGEDDDHDDDASGRSTDGVRSSGNRARTGNVVDGDEEEKEDGMSPASATVASPNPSRMATRVDTCANAMSKASGKRKKRSEKKKEKDRERMKEKKKEKKRAKKASSTATSTETASMPGTTSASATPATTLSSAATSTPVTTSTSAATSTSVTTSTSTSTTATTSATTSTRVGSSNSGVSSRPSTGKHARSRSLSHDDSGDDDSDNSPAAGSASTSSGWNIRQFKRLKKGTGLPEGYDKITSLTDLKRVNGEIVQVQVVWMDPKPHHPKVEWIDANDVHDLSVFEHDIKKIDAWKKSKCKTLKGFLNSESGKPYKNKSHGADDAKMTCGYDSIGVGLELLNLKNVVNQKMIDDFRNLGAVRRNIEASEFAKRGVKWKALRKFIEEIGSIDMNVIQQNHYVGYGEGVEALKDLNLPDGIYVVGGFSSEGIGHVFILEVSFNGESVTIHDKEHMESVDWLHQWFTKVSYVRRMVPSKK